MLSLYSWPALCGVADNLVGDDNILWIAVAIEFAMHGETGVIGGGGDQVDDDTVADKRLGAPVLTDEREQAVLDLVPLAGAWGKVADRDVDAKLMANRCNRRSARPGVAPGSTSFRSSRSRPAFAP